MRPATELRLAFSKRGKVGGGRDGGNALEAEFRCIAGGQLGGEQHRVTTLRIAPQAESVAAAHPGICRAARTESITA